MENRLIFFAVEKTEDAETPQSEKGADNLTRAADDYAKAELVAEKGGHTAVSQAEQIAQNPETPMLTQQIMLKGAQKVKDAVSARNKNLTPETTKKLSEAVAELQRKIKNFEKRKFENAAAEDEIKRMSSLPNAAEIFKDLKITLSSQTKGSITFEWNPDDKKGVEGFGLEQKKAIAKAMRERLTAPPKGVEVSKDVLVLRDKFLSNSEVPKSWKDWLKNPEAGFAGASEQQKSLAYVTKWVSENLGEVVAQSAKFRAISERANANPEASKQLSEKGVATSIDKFRDLSRSERNEVLGKYAEVLAGTDAELAKRAAEAGVSDKAGSENIQAKNTAEIEREKEKQKVSAEKIAKATREFANDQKFAAKVDARKKELEAAGKEAGTAENFANMRARAQAGEKVGGGVGEKFKKLFGFGKKAADDYPGEVGEQKAKIDFGEQARRQIANETLANQNNLRDFSGALGLKGVQASEIANLESLLTAKNFEAATMQSKINSPEMKAFLARRAAGDEEKKMT